MMKMIKEGTE